MDSVESEERLRNESKSRFQPVLSPELDRVHRDFSLLRYLVAITDAAAFLAATVVTGLIQHRLFTVVGDRALVLLALGTLAYILVLSAFGLYAFPRLGPVEEFRRVLGAVTVAVAVVVVFFAWEVRPGPAVALQIWVMAEVLTLGSRRVWHEFVRRRRTEGAYTFRTLIVGTNAEAQRLSRMLWSGQLGYRPVGFIATDRGWEEPGDLPVLGHVNDLHRAIRETGAECVFVAASAADHVVMTKVSKFAREGGAEVRISAGLSDIVTTRLSVQSVGNLLTLSLKPVRLSGMQAATKRTLDFVISTVLLVLAMPFMVVIAVMVKLSSDGAVLYRQERIGLRGQPFMMLKFRTMVTGADVMIGSLRTHNEATGPLFKLRDDPRITRVGRWLRRWSLDELPQLWNVLTGQMSLVGPRPPLPAEVALYEDWHRERLEVRPGMTGLWQVRGRSQLPFDDYVRLDLYYIENWSIAFDLFILAKTVPAVLLGKGAF